MKQKKNLWSDVSILIIAVLLATSFLRGLAQSIAVIAVFALWSAYAIYRHLVPFFKEVKASKEAKKMKAHYEKQAAQQKKDWDIDISNTSGILVLLRHVSYRISAHLKASYPEATWAWCCDNIEDIIVNGGTGRIKVNGIPDFNYAEVTFDQNATIKCQLLNIVPLSEQKKNENSATPKPASESNPEVWFNNTGKKVLTGLIADLNSRGYSSLTIEEDGSIIVMQGDKPFKHSTFDSLPDKAVWPRLKDVMQRIGISTLIKETKMVLSW